VRGGLVLLHTKTFHSLFGQEDPHPSYERPSPLNKKKTLTHEFE